MWRAWLALVTTFFLIGAAAHAQNAEWRHPRGLYAFQPEAGRWRPLPSEEALLATFELAAEPGEARMCFVRERPMPFLQGATQAYINERVDFLRPRLEGSADITTFMIDGVAVMAFRFDDPDGPLVNYRIFVVADGDSASHHEISCGGATPLAPTHHAAFQAFLDTLHFLPMDQRQ